MKNIRIEVSETTHSVNTPSKLPRHAAYNTQSNMNVKSFLFFNKTMRIKQLDF